MRFVKAAALLLLVLCAFAASAHAEVAVVDVVQVIDSSVPGKAGPKYVDNLKSQLDAEFESYKRSVAKDKDAQAKTAQKQAELTAQFRAEYARVTNMVTAELRKIVADYIKTNKRSVTVVVPAGGTLGFSAKADVSKEILRKLNTVKLDFAKK